MNAVTKRVFLSAFTCRRAGWLRRNRAADVPAMPGELLRLEEGLEIGKRARTIFPDGILVSGPNIPHMTEQTKRLMGDAAVRTIFEATFHIEGYTAKADILRRHGNGWHLVEVKSDTSDKPELVDDLAYTAMVMHRCGIPIAKTSLLLISKDYRLGMDNGRLFVEVDHTADVQARVGEFLAAWSHVDGAIRLPEPPPATLTFDCRKCDFFDSDCLGKRVEHHIFDLPRLSQKRFSQLTALEIARIGDIPDDFDLTETQARIRQCVVTGTEYVGTSLRDDLASVVWPAYYLDFETMMTAIPLYPDIAPYTQVPTQYSIHVCSAPGEVIDHREYLADPARDCRRELAERLIAGLGEEGSVIVYHAAFEKTVISKLAEAFPDLATPLRAILPRVVDLEVFILDGFYHPEFRGSYSIKRTLPVMVPGMSYEGLGIGDGDTAMALFARMAKGQVSEKDAQRIRHDLLAYCKQDTLAMVRLHEQMVAVAP